MAKRVVRDPGVPTAPFAVVSSEADAKALGLPFPLFVKPVAEGSGKGARRGHASPINANWLRRSRH